MSASSDAIDFSLDTGEAVIVATGSGTFKTPGWPGRSLTHDGDAMSYSAGAEITGKEWVDYHVTLRDTPDGFGVTGGRAPARFHGEIVYPGIEVRGVLADDMRAHAGDYPSLNAMGGHPEPSTTAVPPLDMPTGPEDPSTAADTGPGGPGQGPPIMVGGSSTGMSPHPTEAVAQMKEQMLAPPERKQVFSPRWVTQILQGVMVPYYVLNVKKEDRLLSALATIEFLRDQFGDNMLANDTHELLTVR
jgi:hypothetical protein